MRTQILLFKALHQFAKAFLTVMVSATLACEPNVLAAASHQSSSSPQFGGTLRLGWYRQPAPFDPFKVTDTITAPLLDLIFNKLVRIDANGAIEPDLVKRWEVSDDGLTYTFFLHTNVAFHNGKDCTAEDVLYTLQLMSDPAVSPVFYKKFEIVREWKAISKNAFQIVLKKSFVPFLKYLWRVYVIPKDGREPHAYLRSLAQHPIGTGPFVFADQDEKGNIRLLANKKYFRGRPYVDGVEVKIFSNKKHVWSAFLRSELDMLFYLDLKDYEEVKNNSAYHVSRHLPIGGYALAANFKGPLLSNLNIREALSLAINREEIIGRLEGGAGVLLNGPFHPKSWAYNHAVDDVNFDPDKASEILKEQAFIKKDKILERENKKFVLNLLVDSNNDHLIQIAKMIRQQLQEIGIVIKIRYLGDHENIAKMIYDKEAPFQIYLFAFNMGTDPDTLASYWDSHRNSPFNFGSYRNPEVDRLFELGRTVHDQEKRAEIYKEIHKIIASEKPAIFLYIPYAIHAASERIGNFDKLSSSFVLFDRFQEIYVAETALNQMRGGESIGNGDYRNEL